MLIFVQFVLKYYSFEYQSRTLPAPHTSSYYATGLYERSFFARHPDGIQRPKTPELCCVAIYV